jgi:hypothetical protein
LLCRYLCQSCGDVSHALHTSRICTRTNHHKIVIHHIEACHPEAFGHELLFGRFVMDEQYIRIAALRQFNGLTRADRYHAHLNTGVLLK